MRNSEHPPGFVSCRHCPKQFQSKGVLLRHIEMKHPSFYSKFKSPYRCQHCDRKFCNFRAVSNHARLCQLRVSGHRKSSTSKIENHSAEPKSNSLDTDSGHQHDQSTECRATCPKEVVHNRTTISESIKNIIGAQVSDAPRNWAQLHNKQYRCYICKWMAKKFMHLKSHLLNEHLLEVVYACSSCDQQFPKLTILRKHQDVQHPGKLGFRHALLPATNRSNEGTHCLVEFNFERKDDRHRSHKCPKCDLTVQRFERLKVHLLREHRLDLFYKCGDCPNTFRKFTELRTHRVEKHCGKMKYSRSFRPTDAQSPTTSLRPHTCGECGRHLGTVSCLRHHLIRHHRMETLYKCNVCDGVDFNAHRKFRGHLMEAHDGKGGYIKTYKPIDNSSTKTATNSDQILIASASKSAHDGTDSTNSCSSFEPNLFAEQIQTATSPFRSPLSVVGRSGTEAVQPPEISEVPGNAPATVKRNQCSECFEQFVFRGRLLSHLKSKHSIMYATQICPLLCDFCDLRFENDEYMIAHISAKQAHCLKTAGKSHKSSHSRLFTSISEPTQSNKLPSSISSLHIEVESCHKENGLNSAINLTGETHCSFFQAYVTDSLPENRVEVKQELVEPIFIFKTEVIITD